MNARPDPIIVARDEVLAELSIQMHGLSLGERLTLLDTLALSMNDMAERIDEEQRQIELEVEELEDERRIRGMVEGGNG
jgi:hypothetical protein